MSFVPSQGDVSGLPGTGDGDPLNPYAIPGDERPDRFDDRIPRCVDAVVEAGPNSLLDVGCGSGVFLQLVRERHPECSWMAGIERDEKQVEVARKRGFDCRPGRIDVEFPFADGSFDMVFAGEIIEHVADPDYLLCEIRRVLKPGGYLLLTTPNLVCWYNRLLVLAGVTPMFVEHSYYRNYGPSYSFARRVTPAVGHLRIFTLTPLKKILEHNGFDCRSIGGAGRQVLVRCAAGKRHRD